MVATNIMHVSLTSELLTADVSIEYRAVNGLQNFAGYLEYFDLGNSSENFSCTETSQLREDNRIILVDLCMHADQPL